MHATATHIGLDIAKNVFVAVARDAHGKLVWKARLSRREVLARFANLPAAAIGIEACAGSHYWARELTALGHDVRLIAAQHTRAYVSGNKNDTNDAAAIAEARSRATTKYVPINTTAQQDLQMLQRCRQALQAEHTAVVNRLRGFALEYGQAFPQGVSHLRRALNDWLAGEHRLSALALHTFEELRTQLDDKQARLADYERRIDAALAEDPRAHQLMAIPGVGRIISCGVLAAVGHARHFGSARDLAANLGLVPREHSSGGRQRLYGITKRGDAYLRSLLIHGARSALRTAADKPDRLLQWAHRLAERRGPNIAAVALANKMARVIWALLAHERPYVPAGPAGRPRSA